MFDRLLSNWVTWVVSIPRTTLFVISLVTLALGWVAASQFKINSDLTQLIRQEAGWRKDFDHFQKEFPQLTRTAVVVLGSSSLQKLESGTDQLVTYLEKRPERFSHVFAPGHDLFIRDRIFLYMNLDQLDFAIDRFALATPRIITLSKQTSLIGDIWKLTDS